MRKHKGINQRTGRLKKGYKYGKNGAIVKAGSATKTTAKRKTRAKRKPAKGAFLRKVKRAVKL